MLFPISLLEENSLGAFITNNPPFFLSILLVHLLSFVALLALQMVLDLKNLSVWSLSTADKRELEDLIKYRWAGFASMVFSGLLLLIADHEKLLSNYFFMAKIALISFAFIFSIFIRDPYYRRHSDSGLTGKLIALVSISLWLATGVLARWVGFS